MTKQSDRLMNARCRLMTREPWYGHIAMSMVWKPSEMLWLPEPRRTMGVRIVNGADIECLYYPPFVDSLTVAELFGVIQHEIEHIVRCHTVRIGARNPEAWNIAADMTVNGQRKNPRVGYKEPLSNELVLPFKGDLVWIPEDWKADETTEYYYHKLEDRAKKHRLCHSCGRPVKGGNKGKSGGSGKDEDKGGGKGKGQSSGHSHGQDGSCGSGNGDGCPACGQEYSNRYEFGGISGRAIDDHDIWNQSEVSADDARQIIKDVVEQASTKAQGSIPSHLAEAIKALGEPVVRWRELLKHYLGKHVGNVRTTYSRRNRRHDRFGVPGKSHHAAAKVNIIVDTSGSIGSRELEQFFAEIDAISARAKSHILQWDADFQGYDPYRRGDWKKLKVHGRGGTLINKAIDWLIDNRLVADVQVMLTDGYTPWAESKEFPMITVITTGEGETDGPGWGHVVRMRVDE